MDNKILERLSEIISSFAEARDIVENASDINCLTGMVLFMTLLKVIAECIVFLTCGVKMQMLWMR